MAIRLDKFLAKTYSNYSRNKIQQFIQVGYVSVNDKVVTQPNHMVDEQDKVVLNLDNKQLWVSRGAYKLLEAIKHWNINLKNKVCLDIGCSTGGFSQVMLKHGAKKVYALDVGTDQFDKSLLSNKVILREKTHFLHTHANEFAKLDFIACDVSFISATKIINHVVEMFNYPFTFVCLIKPQFELTKEILDKCKGSIPETYHQQAITKVCSFATNLGLKCSDVIKSPIQGAKSSNTEYLVYLTKE